MAGSVQVDYELKRYTIVPETAGLTPHEESAARLVLDEALASNKELFYEEKWSVRNMRVGLNIFVRFKDRPSYLAYMKKPIVYNGNGLFFDFAGTYRDVIDLVRVQVLGLGKGATSKDCYRMLLQHVPTLKSLALENDWTITPKNKFAQIKNVTCIDEASAKTLQAVGWTMDKYNVLSYLPGRYDTRNINSRTALFHLTGNFVPTTYVRDELSKVLSEAVSIRILSYEGKTYAHMLMLTQDGVRNAVMRFLVDDVVYLLVPEDEKERVINSEPVVLFPANHFMMYCKLQKDGPIPPTPSTLLLNKRCQRASNDEKMEVDNNEQAPVKFVEELELHQPVRTFKPQANFPQYIPDKRSFNDRVRSPTYRITSPSPKSSSHRRERSRPRRKDRSRSRQRSPTFAEPYAYARTCLRCGSECCFDWQKKAHETMYELGSLKSRLRKLEDLVYSAYNKD
jgi:hypothetical protein